MWPGVVIRLRFDPVERTVYTAIYSPGAITAFPGFLFKNNDNYINNERGNYYE